MNLPKQDTHVTLISNQCCKFPSEIQYGSKNRADVSVRYPKLVRFVQKVCTPRFEALILRVEVSVILTKWSRRIIRS